MKIPPNIFHPLQVTKSFPRRRFPNNSNHHRDQIRIKQSLLTQLQKTISYIPESTYDDILSLRVMAG